MVIDQVHGLQATGMSLNDRFTMFTAAPAPARPRTPRRRPSTAGFYSDNRNLIAQIARRLEQQAKRQSLRQRLGIGAGGLRRFGSESSLPGLRRSNSFGDLSQRGIKSRISWRQSNGNLNRSASFGNLSGGVWRGRGLRGLRRRVGTQVLRGRIRGSMNFGRVNRIGSRAMRGSGIGRGRGAAAAGGRGRGRGGAGGRGRGRGRGAARGRGRGGIARQPAKPVPTKEELDRQLEQYMAGTKAALDKQLDSYMKSAMDLE